ncbi:MFS transporter [Cryobacterium frigoriphilum]|uniref:MFS transporter n=2 Tax=Cryobacterium frigoriphilum TaxID=1259150 RepID=A0A4R9A528_9MICO|nr:MFS transporter [Cryobacterium frigoriphilum]TFD52142.1 MFS transporter [Cryobacterium frigoriphilum]
MLTDISSESVAAILPLYLTSVLGLSTIAFGFIDGLYQGVSAVVRIAGGYAADRTEQPKWVAFFGYAISALARIGLLVGTGFGVIAAVVTIDRLGKGVRTAPRDALITASSLPENLGRSFGVHRMLDTIGAAIGPLLAFLVLFFIPSGYNVIFVVSLAFALLGLVILGLLVPNLSRRPLAATPAGAANAVRAVAVPEVASEVGLEVGPEAPVARPRFRWRYLNDPRLRRLLLVAGIFGLLTVGDGFIYLVLQARSSFAAAWFPLLYVGTNLAFLVCAVPLGRLADRFGRLRVFIIGHGALLAAYVCAALPTIAALATIGCLVLLGIFYAASDGVLAALASQYTPDGSTASGIAAAQTVVALARLLASVGFGFLWFALGRESAVLIVAALLAVAIPAAALLLRPYLARPRVS